MFVCVSLLFTDLLLFVLAKLLQPLLLWRRLNPHSLHLWSWSSMTMMTMMVVMMMTCQSCGDKEQWKMLLIPQQLHLSRPKPVSYIQECNSLMQQSVNCPPKKFYSYSCEKYNKSNLKFLMAKWISWPQIIVDRQPTHAWCNIHKCPSEWPLVPRCRKVAQIAKQIFCKLLKLENYWILSIVLLRLRLW